MFGSRFWRRELASVVDTSVGVRLPAPPLCGPRAVELGSGRMGFLAQPARRAAALAATIKSDLEASFMGWLNNYREKQVIGQPFDRRKDLSGKLGPAWP